MPEAWLLTRRSRCRVFQQAAVPEILRQVFAGLDTAFELSDAYRPRDYCVQYRETDFDFAARLMEDEGISYYFRHGPAGSTLVLADGSRGFPEVPGASRVAFDPVAGGSRPDDRVWSWETSQEVRPARVVAARPPLPARAADRGARPVGRGTRDGRTPVVRAGGRRPVAAGAVRLPRRVRTPARRCRSRGRRPCRRPRAGCRRGEPRRRAEGGTGGVRRPDRQRRGVVPAVHRWPCLPARAAWRCRWGLPADLRPSRGALRRPLPAGAGGALSLHEHLRVHPGRPACPPGPAHAPAVRARPANGPGRRPAGGGDLHRQVRPGEGPVPLGPPGQAGRQQLVLGPRRDPLGGHPAGAPSTSRGSARRSSSTSRRATRTGRSSLGASTTPR